MNCGMKGHKQNGCTELPKEVHQHTSAVGLSAEVLLLVRVKVMSVTKGFNCFICSGLWVYFLFVRVYEYFVLFYFILTPNRAPAAVMSTLQAYRGYSTEVAI